MLGSHMRNKTLLTKICLQPAQPLSAAAACIDASGGEIALVIDAAGRLLGTITDGDIRRAILRGLALDIPASQVMNAKPLWAAQSTPTPQIIARMHDAGISQMPILDEQGIVLDILFAKALPATVQANSHPVVIMAGGLGTRLRPVTESTPKPMVEVGGKPVLETIIRQLRMQGFCSITLCVNHLAEIIIDHFQDGSRFGVEISYVQERQRMGTAGALSLLPQSDLPVIVMNGDILTSVNFNKLLSFHYEYEAHATMGLNRLQYRLPYGVVELENWNITSFVEKPVYDFFINAGIYVIGPAALALVPPEQYFDMPALFDLVPQERRAAFPIHEYWLDIGQHEDLARATAEFKSNFADIIRS